MVNQGDIITLDFNPTKGHEQGGRRPALVISNNEFFRRSGMVMVLPISNNEKKFPLHVPLDGRTKTTGKILCEHVRSIDPVARTYEVVEKIPEDLFAKTMEIFAAEIE